MAGILPGGDARRQSVSLVGDIRATLDALLPRIGRKTQRAHLDGALANYRQIRAELDSHVRGCKGRTPIHPGYLTTEVSAAAAADAAFTADVGGPVVWAARYLRMRRGQRLIGSFNHGSMAAAMPLAIGIQAANPERQVIALASDGGFAMLMGDYLTLLQHKLPVKIIVYNNSSLGFVEIERKAASYLEHGTTLENQNFACIAQAAGGLGIRVEDPTEVRPALEQAFAERGPVLLDVVTNRHELPLPPTTTLEHVIGFLGSMR